MNGFISEDQSLKNWLSTGAYEFFNSRTKEQLKAFITLSRRKRDLDINYDIALIVYNSKFE